MGEEIKRLCFSSFPFPFLSFCSLFPFASCPLFFSLFIFVLKLD